MTCSLRDRRSRCSRIQTGRNEEHAHLECFWPADAQGRDRKKVEWSCCQRYLRITMRMVRRGLLSARAAADVQTDCLSCCLSRESYESSWICLRSITRAAVIYTNRARASKSSKPAMLCVLRQRDSLGHPYVLYIEATVLAHLRPAMELTGPSRSRPQGRSSRNVVRRHSLSTFRRPDLVKALRRTHPTLFGGHIRPPFSASLLSRCTSPAKRPFEARDASDQWCRTLGCVLLVVSLRHAF